MAWIKRFSFNAKQYNREKKISGPITTSGNRTNAEFLDQEQNIPKFEEDRARLNLQENKEHILECRGRIQGEFPVYLPDIQRETRSGCAKENIAWGSRIHDEQDTGDVLDTTIKTAREKSDS